MATWEGVDYSFDRPNAMCLRINGKLFACRYVAGGSTSKHLTAAEARILGAAGIAVVCTFEAETGRALAGGAAGQADAEAARQAMTVCGAPPDRPCYFAVDFDATPAQLVEVEQYIMGAASILTWANTGVYGGIRTIDYLLGRNRCRWGWQTYAWSGTSLSPRAQLYQYRNHVSLCGATVDYDRALVADVGQWLAGTPAGAPAPLPGPDPVVVGSWDYNPSIDGVGTSVGGLAAALSTYATAVDGIRTL